MMSQHIVETRVQGLMPGLIHELEDSDLPVAFTEESTSEPNIPLPANRAEAQVWDVWPYIWFINGYLFFTEWFHSFHEKLILWHLSRHNRRAQAAFWATYWQRIRHQYKYQHHRDCHWQEAMEDEFQLKLI